MASPAHPTAGLCTNAGVVSTSSINATKLPEANPAHVQVKTKPDASLGEKRFKDPVKPPESNPEKQNDESDSMVDSLDSYLEDPHDKRIFGKYNCSKGKRAVLLLVGRSQSGKSSTVSVLIDPRNSILSNGVSGTVNPTLHTLVVCDKRNGSVVQLNVIDTPGLGQVSANDFDTRSDEYILEVTKTFVKHQVKHLNLIAFVTPAGETNLLDTKYFKLIADFVGDEFKQISCLLLSKADTVDANRLSEMIEAIETSEVLKFCEKGIVPIGAVNYESVAALEDEKIQRETVKGLLDKVGEMRQNLLQFIVNSTDRLVQVAKLNDVYEQITAVEDIAVRDFMSRQLPSTSNSSDSGSAKHKRQTVTENSEDVKAIKKSFGSSWLKVENFFRGLLQLPPHAESNDAEKIASAKSEDRNFHVKTVGQLLRNENKMHGLDGNFTTHTAKTVNVLLFGRSHAGKSSIVQVLQDPRISLRKSAWSSTREAKVYRLVVEDTEAQELYNLNIIDTPGLGEAVKQSKDYRDDSTLVNLAKQCLIWEITILNCVAFVSPFEQTIMLDTGHFKTVKEFLGEHMSSVSMLLLTHADSYSQEFQEKYLREIQEHRKTKEMAEFCKLGVGVTGAVCLDNLKGLTTNPSTLRRLVQKKLEFVAKNRCDLIDKLLKCEKAVPIEALMNWDTQQLDAAIAKAVRSRLQFNKRDRVT